MKNLRFILFFFILQVLFYSPAVFADVYSFPDRELHISLTTEAQNYGLVLRDNATGRELNYNPNVGSVLTPTISYGPYFSLSWGFRGPVSEANKVNRGNTRYTDIRFDFSYHQFLVNAFYSQYSGLYLENSSTADPGYADTEAKIQRPDLYARVYGVSMTWVFNEESFSIPNLLTQAERQERNGGSFLFGGSFTETIVRADSELVPTNLANDFDVLGNFSGGKFQTLSAKVGYGYSLASRWFLGGAILMGPGLSRRTFRYSNRGESRGWEPALRSEFFFSGGYNGDHFFAAFRGEAMQDIFYLSGSSSQIASQVVSVGLNVGIHLSTLGF